MINENFPAPSTYMLILLLLMLVCLTSIKQRTLCNIHSYLFSFKNIYGKCLLGNRNHIDHLAAVSIFSLLHVSFVSTTNGIQLEHGRTCLRGTKWPASIRVSKSTYLPRG